LQNPNPEIPGLGSGSGIANTICVGVGEFCEIGEYICLLIYYLGDRIDDIYGVRSISMMECDV